MWRRLPARRALLFLAAAVLSAVVSDWAIETAAYLGLWGPAFAAHDQRSVVATATAGLVLALAAIVVSLLERCCRRKGVVVTETSADQQLVTVIQAHGREVTGFVNEGMGAMMRDMISGGMMHR